MEDRSKRDGVGKSEPRRRALDLESTAEGMRVDVGVVELGCTGVCRADGYDCRSLMRATRDWVGVSLLYGTWLVTSKRLHWDVSPLTGQSGAWVLLGAAAADAAAAAAVAATVAAWAHCRRRCSGTGPPSPHLCLESQAPRQTVRVRCAPRGSPPYGCGGQNRTLTTRRSSWPCGAAAAAVTSWRRNCDGGRAV